MRKKLALATTGFDRQRRRRQWKRCVNLIDIEPSGCRRLKFFGHEINAVALRRTSGNSGTLAISFVYSAAGPAVFQDCTRLVSGRET
jgi:hypothetical protein